MPEIPIDRTELQRLCELARLHLPADREAAILGQLQRIVDAFGQLRAIDTSGLPAAPPPPPTPLRPDEAETPLPTATVLDNAPQRAADCFVVPRVVDA